MKTLIVHDTEYGFSKKASEKIMDNLGDEVTLVNLKKQPIPELNLFNRVIIGGSVRGGKLQKRVKDFCYRNIDELKRKELGLFICCIDEREAAESQFMEAYPEELVFAAKSTAVFKGNLNFERMNFLERFIVKKVSYMKHSSQKIDFEAVKLFSRRMDRVFNPFLFLA